ncbi:hypothetical protein DL95DRAFT_462826 [Leptodontidium sp. 2 PMI_412]|nr:hypothetical protein DL95DRAFT_462826 [Leptodontidium sp. 2 PMI_412]
MAASPVMMAYSKTEFDHLFARTVMVVLCESENMDPGERGCPMDVALEYIAMLEMTDEQYDRYFETCDFELLRTMLADAADRVKTICQRRIVTATGKGRMGPVPDRTEVEDCLFLLEGGDVPFCYLDGVMYGEAYEKEKCRDAIVV